MRLRQLGKRTREEGRVEKAEKEKRDQKIVFDELKTEMKSLKKKYKVEIKRMSSNCLLRFFFSMPIESKTAKKEALKAMGMAESFDDLVKETRFYSGRIPTGTLTDKKSKDAGLISPTRSLVMRSLFTTRMSSLVDKIIQTGEEYGFSGVGIHNNKKVN